MTSVFDADTWGSTLPSVAVSAVLEIGSSGAMFVAVGAVGSSPWPSPSASNYGKLRASSGVVVAQYVALYDAAAYPATTGLANLPAGSATFPVKNFVTSLATAASSPGFWTLSSAQPLYVGGYFTSVGQTGTGAAVGGTGYVAAWDGAVWSALGGGVATSGSGQSGGFVAALAAIQGDLFTMGAELACVPGKEDKLRLRLLDESDVERLEALIDQLDPRLAPLTTFVLPGGTRAAAMLHLARTVCRRAERAIHALDDTPTRPSIVQYLNRLSDLLFVLARFANHEAGRADVPWMPTRTGA
jgi:cob(I)alamin adenosyltransferase